MPQNSRVNRKILTVAAFEDNFDMVRLLFEFGYKIDVNFPNANRGKTERFNFDQSTFRICINFYPSILKIALAIMVDLLSTVLEMI